MHLVRVGTLRIDDAFRTTLTRRIGIVLATRPARGVLVYLEPLRPGDAFEEKLISPQTVVAVDEPAAEAAITLREAA